MENRKVKIFDTTLRDGEQSPGCSMHLNEKLDIAEALENMGVDVIEAGFPASSEEEFRAVREIASVCKKSTVAVLCRCRKEDIDRGYEAIKDANHPCIHIFIATSPIHLAHKLKIDEQTCLDIIDTHTRYSRTLVDNVEFSFEDASRTPLEFLKNATQTAINAGATTINIPDTVGYSTPHEMANIISFLRSNVSGIENVTLSVHCHDDLGMAVANSLAAVRAGATQVECTVNGIGERAGNAAMEEIVMAIKTRHDFFNLETAIDTTKISRVSKLVSSVVGIKVPPNKAIVGANAFLHESGIHQHGILQDKATYEIMNPTDIGVAENSLLLGKHSGRHAFQALTEEMGYSLSSEQIDAFFPKYKDMADRKKSISRMDIEALLTTATRRKIVRKYSLLDYEITAYKNSSSAIITLESEGKAHTDRMTGDGPVDASFKTISALTGQDFTLVDFQVHAVTEGKDALGEATVKLTNGEKMMTGKGISTDVLEASLTAYLNATNKLLQEG